MGSLDYYAALARRLSAAELARAAVRRAYRTARTRFFRVEDASRRAQIQQAYLASTSAELAERLCQARPWLTWCNPRRRVSVRAALDRVPGARDRALRRADDAAANRFVLFGRKLDFGPDAAGIDWSLDVSSGHRYPKVAADALPLFQAGSDPKFPWALARLEGLVALGQGSWATASTAEAHRYAAAFAAQLGSFLTHNPPGFGVHWTCTMEVALRGANLAQALSMFLDHPRLSEGMLLWDTLEALAAHAAYVEAHLEDAGAVPNNHLVADLVGLLVMAVCFPELPGAPRWMALAVQGLRTQLPAQVHADGWSFEGSVAYHRLACELFALAYLFAQDAGVPLGAAYEGRLRAMFRVARDCCSEAGLAPQLGDNDSGRALAVSFRKSLEHAYLSPWGAALLEAAELKVPGWILPDEGVWLLGLEGLERFAKLEPRGRPRSRLSLCSGLHVLRGGGLLVALSAGPHGQRGVGGHNHNDQLSFELHVDGIPTVVDPGSPVYGGSPSERNRFRGTAMHNTPELDGKEQSPFDPERLFLLESHTRTRLVRVERSSAFASPPAPAVSSPPSELPADRGEEEEPVLRVLASHQGYAPVEVTRGLELWVTERVLVGRDELCGPGEHKGVFRFHLPDRHALLRGPTDDELATAGKVVGAGVRFAAAVELGPKDSRRAVLLLEEGPEVTLEESDYSSGYGERRPAYRVVARMTGRLPIAFRWLVWAGRGEG